MSMENSDWDPAAFKALLRTTAQRLGKLQERKDSQCRQARRDVATCLARGELGLARARAATAMQQEALGDLLEEVEMWVGVVGGHVRELGHGWDGAVSGEGEGEGEGVNGDGERGGCTRRLRGPTTLGLASSFSGLPRLSPALAEAAASIIHATPSVEFKDLNGVRDVLIQRLGPAFGQTASASQNNNVSLRIMQILSSFPPTATKMDAYLVNIAQTHGVKWAPEPRREDLLAVISEILRVDAWPSSPVVDLPRLREICARGLPDDPSWVRPRIWRLLFGTLPILKTTWVKESRKQRESYYDLVRRLLSLLPSLPAPTTPFSPTDTLIVRISDSLSRVSPDLFGLLGNEPKSVLSGKCPLDPTAPDDIQISCASNLDKRLSLLQRTTDASGTPEIRLETDLHGSGPASASASPPSSSAAITLASRPQHRPTTLLPSKAYSAPPAHHAHTSALLRLLYIHGALNPAVQSPHVPWLLVPLYSVLAGETNEDDVAHAEADTFWVFEALVGEIAEMEEEEGGKIWTQKLSERVRWADGDLATSLHATGLDPALPHYSYGWLAPLLAQTLPLSSVLPVWDALFARPMRTRDVNPKLEHLVDICTALLIRARAPLFRLGKLGRNAPDLWTQDSAALRPPSPLRPWELSDAFKEGIVLLTFYPIDAAGGIDRIFQMTSDLAQRRIEAKDKDKERDQANVGFGARITQRMWKGFTNQVEEEEEEGEEEEAEEEEEEEIEEETGDHDDGNETETPAAPTLTSRLANTVWRGITNQSSMDDEVPSPTSPSSPRQSPTPPEDHDAETSSSSQANLWNYAGKLKDSDAIAAFAKVSTNFRAKALDAWHLHGGSNASASSGPASPARAMSPSAEAAPRQSGGPKPRDADAPGQRRGSLPGTQRESERAGLDPPRPAFFRSPRESFLPQPRRQHATAPSSPVASPPPRDSDTESNASSLIHRAGASLASLAALSSSHPTPKSVPKPLMLSSRDLTIAKSAKPQLSTRSEGGTPGHRSGQWRDVLANSNRHGLRQESVSSTSSLSLPEGMHRRPFSGGSAPSAGAGTRSDYDSDGSAATTSRKVPLNRKSVSPMALASRSPNLPWNAPSPVVGRGGGHPLSNGSLTAEDVDTASERGWQNSDAKERAQSGGAATGSHSPTTTVASPSIPPTPLMPPVSGPGVRIVNGGHAPTSSISTLSEASEVPRQSRLLVRDKAPATPTTPPAGAGDGHGHGHESGSESVERTPSGKMPVKLRSKRYAPRAGNLRVRTGMGTGAAPAGEQRTPSPGRGLGVEWPAECELATTPRVESYSAGTEEDEEGSEEGAAVPSRPPYTRKPSKEARLRKVSPGSIKDTRRVRDSGASDGDDEGYGDLLSAYESEEGSRE